MSEKVIKITPNDERAKSLLKASTKTLDFAEGNKLGAENSGVLIGNYYESLIEILHSHAYQNGFKILDHISFVNYIKEKMNNNNYANLFDKYRKIRNNIIYYGKEIDVDTAQQGIKDIKELINHIKGEIKI
jgi:hypothetical protein